MRLPVINFPRISLINFYFNSINPIPKNFYTPVLDCNCFDLKADRSRFRCQPIEISQLVCESCGYLAKRNTSTKVDTIQRTREIYTRHIINGKWNRGL